MQTIRFLSQEALLLALCAVGLAACGANQPVTYAGDLTPIAGTCDPAGRAVLIKRGQYVAFTPRQGVLILNGKIGPGGQVAATAQTPGADRKPYQVKFAATLAGDAITGAYTTPRCRYAVKLSLSP